MFEEVLYLTPDAQDGPSQDAIDQSRLRPSDPAIMIPAISDDGSLYPVEKIKAHVEGVHHLALSVFVFSGDELLIQRRAHSKYHCGGLWANTCCTHPFMNESVDEAAKRRLQEELGFQVPVEERRIVEYSADVGKGLWERERVHMFRAEGAKSEIVINPNPEEVSEVKWIDCRELHADIKTNPDHYTPWFRIYVSRFPDFDF